MERSEEPVVVLSAAACWELVAGVTLGRLVTRVGEIIEIAPVNYVVDGESLVFRTGSGSKLSALTINRAVTFQVDAIGEDEGWSVVLHGTAHALETAAELEAVADLPLRPLVPTLKPTFVRIDVHAVNGRGYRFGEEPQPEDVQEG
ncbi:pyridoxamine 5'-phosphate oxidase family protein [Leucobacter luti]|uniref:Nitroimidazol reductase NimA-like FMN-containing flavoprotein (Pyridoxamine 5'-phosphate oxidase superfamily) n=1 Tax=Leucobacter luti TaxID=340320 RepID=A0A4Q7U5M2_9MICO|nr:pyridoxamine 5'-phosphate oxidase family protein [Leucobacter luti]MBL3700852.1 pyridoxamine 5'-phosphate oxidase family protein [Leucobacter luti]RZT68310.1 nitroimidazol reductase NimA-like FMN-containing flavoprotein (pyridoxamine 5'-phosphate oxidase superfamily) [Leucobacter luti]